jgi:hypothetical protein
MLTVCRSRIKSPSMDTESQEVHKNTLLTDSRSRKQGSTQNYESSSGYPAAHKPDTSLDNSFQDTGRSEQYDSEPGSSIWTDYLESDIEPQYEGSRALNQLRPTLALHLLVSYEARSAEPRSYGIGDSGQPGTVRSSTNFATTGDLPSSMQSSREKRARDDRSPDDGSGSPGDGGRPSKVNRNSPVNKDIRLLACPFYKKDPRKYRCCNQHILREINRVK